MSLLKKVILSLKEIKNNEHSMLCSLFFNRFDDKKIFEYKLYF